MGRKKNTETPAMDKLMRMARDDPRRMRWVWFVEAFLTHGDGSKAVREAKFETKTPRRQSYKLLRIPEVVAAIEEGNRRLLDEMELKAEDVIEEYTNLAFRDIADCFDYDGNLKKVHDMPEKVRRAIKSIQYKNGHIDKIIFESKTEALQGLGRYFKLFTDNVELTGAAGLAEMMMKGRQRLRMNENNDSVDGQDEAQNPVH